MKKSPIISAEIHRYLISLSYPKSKSEIVSHAKSQKAPNIILKILNKIKDRTYVSTTDLGNEIEKIELSEKFT